MSNHTTLFVRQYLASNERTSLRGPLGESVDTAYTTIRREKRRKRESRHASAERLPVGQQRLPLLSALHLLERVHAMRVEPKRVRSQRRTPSMTPTSLPSASTGCAAPPSSAPPQRESTSRRRGSWRDGRHEKMGRLERWGRYSRERAANSRGANLGRLPVVPSRTLATTRLVYPA